MIRVEHITDTVTVYCGDNREIAPTLVGIDGLVSDPPYGMDWNTDSTRFSRGAQPNNRKRGQGRSDWGLIVEDAQPFDPSPWLGYPAVVLWGSNHYAARLPVGKTLVWLKKSPEAFGTFLSDAEIGWASGGHGVFAHYRQFSPPSRAFENGDAKGGPAHPTQKPISLMRWCIETFAPKARRILDPYMGSGSTGVAAMHCGRSFVGIEINPTYFDTACRRLAAAVSSASQASLLDTPRPAREEQGALL